MPRAPREDYTKALVSAVPSLRPRHRAGPRAPAPVLEIKALDKTDGGRASLFGGRGREVHAVRQVSLEAPRWHSLALVGESGSGKPILARCIVGLESGYSGEFLRDGENIAGLTRKHLEPYRHLVQMVFITHDLRVAAHVCETIVVMCRGATVEIFANPQHEYTRQLLESVPGKQWDH